MNFKKTETKEKNRIRPYDVSIYKNNKQLWILFAIHFFHSILFGQAESDIYKSQEKIIKENINHECIYDPKKTNNTHLNKGEDIQKIRDQYNLIEKYLNTYQQYKLYKDEDGNPLLIHLTLVKNDFEEEEYFIYGGKEFFPTYDSVLFYFNELDEIVYIEESSWNGIAINSGGSSLNKYYFLPGASYPFFVYTYSNTYFKNFEYDKFADTEIVSESEKFNEYRIYSEINSTLAKVCPKIIRALRKNYEVEKKKKIRKLYRQ